MACRHCHYQECHLNFELRVLRMSIPVPSCYEDWSWLALVQGLYHDGGRTLVPQSVKVARSWYGLIPCRSPSGSLPALVPLTCDTCGTVRCPSVPRGVFLEHTLWALLGCSVTAVRWLRQSQSVIEAFGRSAMLPFSRPRSFIHSSSYGLIGQKSNSLFVGWSRQ
jgi:hypothetical protein